MPYIEYISQIVCKILRKDFWGYKLCFIFLLLSWVLMSTKKQNLITPPPPLQSNFYSTVPNKRTFAIPNLQKPKRTSNVLKSDLEWPFWNEKGRFLSIVFQMLGIVHVLLFVTVDCRVLLCKSWMKKCCEQVFFVWLAKQSKWDQSIIRVAGTRCNWKKEGRKGGWQQ